VLRGRVDHPLTPQGWQQMWQATGLWPVTDPVPAGAVPWQKIITSPLQRCRSFAEKLAVHADLPIAVEPDWQEIDYGDWDGMPLVEWRRAAAGQFKAFRSDLTALHPPGGEAFIHFRDRILTAWEQILQRPEGSHLLLVTHGGVMRVVLPTILGMPLNQTGVLDIPFACLSRIEITGPPGRRQGRLHGHNLGALQHTKA